MRKEIFKNKKISQKLKLRLKNTIIDKMLTYASEACQQINRDRKKISIFEMRVHSGIGKGKALLLQAWRGPEGSRRLRLPDFKTIGT